MILVISHPRSGTHFTINSIAFNFGYDNKQFDLEAGKSFDFDTVKEKQIVKTHLLPEALESVMCRALNEEWKLFYVIRDPLDTLWSQWNYWRKHPNIFPQDSTFSLHVDRNWRYWQNHVLKWKNWFPWMCVVRYEDLFRNWDRQVDLMGDYLQSKPIASRRRPKLKDRGVDPWKGGMRSREESDYDVSMFRSNLDLYCLKYMY